jgi:hypothetical protein
MSRFYFFIYKNVYMTQVKQDKKFLKKSLLESFSETTWEDVMGYGANMFYINCFIFWIAIFLSFRCNDGFDLPELFMAYCCAPCYVVYKLGTSWEDCIR